MSEPRPAPSLSHLDHAGQARMVDVSGKPVTPRQASASARITMAPHVLEAITGGKVAKGDVAAAARLAGIQAAKRTAELIPLCHPLPIDQIEIVLQPRPPGELLLTATVKVQARTGAEMEALTAVAVAALTVYDMCKSADRAMLIGPVRLESKSGGKSGDYRAAPPDTT